MGKFKGRESPSIWLSVLQGRPCSWSPSEGSKVQEECMLGWTHIRSKNREWLRGWGPQPSFREHWQWSQTSQWSPLLNGCTASVAYFWDQAIPCGLSGDFDLNHSRYSMKIPVPHSLCLLLSLILFPPYLGSHEIGLAGWNSFCPPALPLWSRPQVPSHWEV